MFESDKPNEQSGWSASDVGHTVLDVAGLIPVIGEAADVANAAWYAAEGNYLDAGLSLISVIPVVGDVIGKGGKLAKNLGSKATIKILETLKDLNIPAFLSKFKSHPELGKHIDKISDALKKWQDELAQKFQPADSGTGAVKCPDIFKPTSGGAIIKSNPNRTTTILGNFEYDMNRIINKELKVPQNTDFGPKPGGFNVLNVPGEMYINDDQFWKEINEKFLDAAIERGDDILMASDPKLYTNSFRTDGTISGFGREIQHLYKNGYKYDPGTHKMIKPK